MRNLTGNCRHQCGASRKSQFAIYGPWHSYLACQVKVNPTCFGAVMSIPGLMLYGAVSLLQGEDDAVPSASNEPVWLSADMIDRAIASGKLQAGAFNQVTVIPVVSEWPARWQHLKTKE